MVDALGPAVDGAARAASRTAATLGEAIAAAAAAAEEGARATVPMQARKGRASYLGERSIGHQDPGATSTALIIARAGARPRAGGLMGERLLRGLPASPGMAAGRARVLDRRRRRRRRRCRRPSGPTALAAARAALRARRRGAGRARGALRADGRAPRPRSSRPAC